MAPQTTAHPDVALNLALAVVDSSNAPLLLLDSNLALIAASKSFCRAFQIDPRRVTGLPFRELGSGEWDLPQLMSLLKATAASYAAVDGYEIDLCRVGRENRRLVLNAQKLDYGVDESVRLLVAVSDVTDARIAEKLKDDMLKEKAVLLQELQHRVANSLQIIASVLMQSARKVQSEETRGHLHDAHKRVMSVAALQQQLSSSSVSDVKLRPYFTALCDSIGASMIRGDNQLSLDLNVDESITSADDSVSLGLIVTELVINALKHAFPGDRSGKIKVDYHSHGPNWTLSVTDRVMEECKHCPRTCDGCNRQNQQRTIFEIEMHMGAGPFAHEKIIPWPGHLTNPNFRDERPLWVNSNRPSKYHSVYFFQFTLFSRNARIV